MHDGTNDPATVPVPSGEKPGPAAGRRAALWLGLGGGVGLALGILLSTSVFTTYTFLTHTLPATNDSVQVFNELNEMRQQINQLNEANKVKDEEKAEAVRQALSAVTSTVRVPSSGATGGVPAVMKPGEAAEAPRVAKPGDPYADIDAEIERLEQTQKVLNSILDMFTPKKEPAKDR